MCEFRSKDWLVGVVFVVGLLSDKWGYRSRGFIMGNGVIVGVEIVREKIFEDFFFLFIISLLGICID